MQHGSLAFFARLFRIAPARPPSEIERGAEALRAGRLDEAWEAFTVALATGDAPAQAYARNKRALVHLARGDRRAAADELILALETHAACVPALVNLGNLQLEDGDVPGAVARFTAAIALDPDSGDAHHNLGVAYRRLGRHADAVRALRRATALELRTKVRR